jgi:hypothetical protein
VAAAEPPSLQSILSHPLPAVEARLQKEIGATPDDASLLVREAKRWLYACAQLQKARAARPGADLPGSLTITPELIPIDRAWHCFLLFTREYERFCSQFLGTFIHHDPLPEEERARFAALRERDPVAALRDRQDSLRPQLLFLGELFGAEAPAVLKLWFEELPKRFHFPEHQA